MRHAFALLPLLVLHCGGDAQHVATPTTAGTAGPAKMVHFDGGDFMMGAPDGQGDKYERPQHSVKVAPFDLDVTEVTVGAYAACVKAGACSRAATTIEGSNYSDEDKKTWSQFCNGSRADRANHPANCVDLEQAKAYCAWAGKRLPTEPEWELAARGTAGRTYPWGEDEPNETRANACGSECVAMAKEQGHQWGSLYPASDGWPNTAPVGSYPAGRTPEGIDDMSGNVWELTSTTFSRYGESATGDSVVARGGCWDSYMSKSLHTTNRISTNPTSRSNVVGFRCAK